MKKKIIIGLIVLILLAVPVYYLVNNKSTSTTKVYPVSNLYSPPMMDMGNMYQGVVITDQLQPVFVSSTQEITEILVTEGQSVKKGDILLTYDSTLSEISLVKKELEIQKYQLELERLNKELAEINSYRAGVPIVIKEPSTLSNDNQSYTQMSLDNKLDLEVVFTDFKGQQVDLKPIVSLLFNDFNFNTKRLNEEPIDPELPTEPEDPVDPELPTNPEEPVDPEEPVEHEKPKYLLGGVGTEEEPYLVLYSEELEFGSELIKELSEEENVYVTLVKYTNNDIEQPLLLSLTFKFFNQFQSFSLVDIVINPSEPIVDEPIDEDPIIDDPGFEEPLLPPVIEEPPTITYTAEEILKMKNEKESEIRNADLNRKTASMELDNLKQEIENNFVLSKLDGVVGPIIDIEEAKTSGSQLLQVSSSGSFIIETTINEFDLETVNIGDKMSVMSYENQSISEGEVISISKYPSTNNMMFYNPDPNLSVYPVKLKVDKSADLKEYSWVEITPQQTDTEFDMETIYLMNAFINTDQDIPFILVAEDGKLVKREVRLGRVQYGSMTEILDNQISLDEMIAFPYDKNAKVGNSVEEGSFEELYGY